MHAVMNELNAAMRALRRSPGYAALAVFLFAIGIAATTILFGVLKTVVLDPLPYPQPNELMRIRESKLPDFPEFAVAPGKFARWQQENRSFSGLAMSSGRSYNLTGLAQPERLDGARVTPEFFRVLGAPMTLGGDFSGSQQGGELALRAVLSEAAWHRLFAADPAVLGRVVQLDGLSYTVVGIAPHASWIEADVFTPWILDATDLGKFGSHSAEVLGRLKPGVSPAQGLADLDRIAELIEQDHEVSIGWRVTMSSLADVQLSDLRGVLALLFGAALLVLLIAVLNVACLALLRAARRQREFEARMALGASGGRIARQLMMESLLLAMIGGLLGCLLSLLVFAQLRQSVLLELPRIDAIRLDPIVLTVCLLASLIAGSLAALLPARGIMRRAQRYGLRGGGRGQLDGQLRSALVVAEITLAVMLLTGTSLLTRSLLVLAEKTPGFAPEQLLYTRMSLPQSRYPDAAAMARFQQQLSERLESMAGVRSAGLTHAWPLLEDTWLQFEIQNQPPADPQQPPTALYYLVTPDVLTATGLQLQRGRWLADTDRAQSAPVVVINQSLARRYFADRDPIGQRIQTSTGGEVWAEVVGIVGDTFQYGLDSEVQSQVYLPLAQIPRPDFYVLLNSTSAADALRAALLQVVGELDPGLPAPPPVAMQSRLSDSMFLRRLLFWLVSGFGGTAIVLAAVGLYSTIAYAVSQSQREFGLRIALGASSLQMLVGVLRQGLRLALIGALLGLGLSLLTSASMQAWIYGVSALDPLTYCLVPLTMLLIAALACLWPALRVARMGPMAALQSAD